MLDLLGRGRAPVVSGLVAAAGVVLASAVPVPEMALAGFGPAGSAPRPTGTPDADRSGSTTVPSRGDLGVGFLGGGVAPSGRGRRLRPARVVGVHALRPALTPVVTFIAANVGQLFVGLLVVEGVFGVPGLAGTLFQAIKDRDRALLIGLVTVVMVVVIVANAVADVLAVVLDPRVRLEG